MDQEEENNLLDAEISFFHEKDTNKDGALSKKEFYYAIMEDEFEGFAKRHAFSVVDLEFEAHDRNQDKKINLEEWKGIFFHDSPQIPDYIDGVDNTEVDTSELWKSAPIPESAPPAKQESQLQVEGEVADSRGLRYYLSEGATWYQSRRFCILKNRRLCSYEEICPSINNDDKIPGDMKMTRWVPMRSEGHLWIEARNCGLTRFPDTAEHSGLIPCCSDSEEEMFDAKKTGSEEEEAREQQGSGTSNASATSQDGSDSILAGNKTGASNSSGRKAASEPHVETKSSFEGAKGPEEDRGKSTKGEEEHQDASAASKKSSKSKAGEQKPSAAEDPVAEQKAKLRAARKKAAATGSASSSSSSSTGETSKKVKLDRSASAGEDGSATKAKRKNRKKAPKIV